MPGTASYHHNFGARLSEWRAARRESQLSLAFAAGVSQRHVSFMESGRTRPSREMVVRLCEALQIPLRARNELLVAAGFAPLYAERPLGGAEMEAVRETLSRILAHHEPYPAFVLDQDWDVVSANSAGKALVCCCVGAATLASLSTDGPLNFMRLMFEPTQMRARIRNWPQIGSILTARLRREVAADPGTPSAALLRELVPGAPALHDAWEAPLTPTALLELELDEGVLRLFNTITTFGTPQDVTVQALRIEMSFPADDSSEAVLRKIAARTDS